MTSYDVFKYLIELSLVVGVPLGLFIRYLFYKK